MNRKTLFTALACALLVFSMLGCGTTNHLQSIELFGSGTTGALEIKGWGGTLQLQAIGTYSSGKTKNLSNMVTYAVTPDGNDSSGNALLAPPQTVQYSPAGLLTAVDPAVCTFLNIGTATSPSWVLSGSYKVLATFEGITSQPLQVAVASAVPAGQTQCGP